MIDVYDYDMSGSEDFLGKIELSLPQIRVWAATEQTLVLKGKKDKQSSDKKEKSGKEKVKATLTFELI